MYAMVIYKWQGRNCNNHKVLYCRNVYHSGSSFTAGCWNCYFCFGEKEKLPRGISVQTSGGSGKNQVYVDKNNVVHIHCGAFIDMRRFAQELYPLGSLLAVWYDPANPHRAYVGKIPEKRSVTGIVFLRSGIGLVLLSLCVSALILFV